MTDDLWNVIMLSTILVIGAGIFCAVAVGLASVYAALND